MTRRKADGGGGGVRLLSVVVGILLTRERRRKPINTSSLFSLVVLPSPLLFPNGLSCTYRTHSSTWVHHQRRTNLVFFFFFFTLDPVQVNRFRGHAFPIVYRLPYSVFFYDWNLTTAPFKSGSSWLFFFVAYFDGWSVTRPLHYSKCSIDPSFYPWRSSRRMWVRWSIFSRVCLCVMVDKRERRPLDTHTLRIIIGYTHSTKREHCQIDYPPPPADFSPKGRSKERKNTFLTHIFTLSHAHTQDLPRRYTNDIVMLFFSPRRTHRADRR